MTALTTAFHEHTLFPLDRYPPDRAVDALAMWVAWLLDDYCELQYSLG
jgi:hypothetical protein